MNIDLTSTEDIIQEGVRLFTFETLYFENTFVWKFNVLIVSSIYKFCKSCDTLSYFLVSATFVILEDLDHNFLIIISITQSICISYHMCPWDFSVHLLLTFWFVDWHVLTWRFESIDGEELTFIESSYSTWYKLDSSLAEILLLLLDSYFYTTRIAFFWVW
jgi:hypothetical protein